MFGVDVDGLLNAYCKPRVRVGTEWVNKGQNVEQVGGADACTKLASCAFKVNWAKGAMTKGIYNRLFNWLVMKCNMTLDQKELERVQWCGVLDIAGFEIFDVGMFFG
jgi:myosin protein heavy chain